MTVDNAFCPTGKGGGVDPTCSPGKGSGGLPEGINPTVPSISSFVRKSLKEGKVLIPKSESTSRVSSTGSSYADHLVKVKKGTKVRVLPTKTGFRVGVDGLGLGGAKGAASVLRSSGFNVDEPSDAAASLTFEITANSTPYPIPPGIQVLKTNAFCPTGKGGGVDPTCSPGEFPSVEAAHKEAKKDWKAWAKQLKPHHFQALDDYQSGAYQGDLGGEGGVFDKLRKGEKLDIGETNMILRLGYAVRGAETKRDVMVFRGLGYKETNYKVGDVVEDKAFMSTSMVRSHVEGVYADTEIYGSPTILELKLPKGTPAAYLDAGGKGKSMGEAEVLLPQYTKYKVISVGKDEKGRIVVRGEVVEAWRETTTNSSPFPVPPGIQVLKTNAFCPTGKGGGVDPTCSPKGSYNAKSGKSTLPSSLYYNANDPIAVLVSGRVLPSDSFQGVSLTSARGLKSHGPFEIELEVSSKSELIPALYGEPIREEGKLRPIGMVDQFGNKYSSDEWDSLPSDFQDGAHAFRMNDMFSDEQEWRSLHAVEFKVKRIRVYKNKAGWRIDPSGNESKLQQLRKLEVEIVEVDATTTNSSPIITSLTATDSNGNEFSLPKSAITNELVQSLTTNATVRPNPLLMDPTGTGKERKALEKAIMSRLKMLKQAIVETIVTEDVFGLKGMPSVYTSNLASTQVDITDPKILATILDIQNRIDPADLVEFEDKSHITVRYGLHDLDPKRVEWIISQYSSVRVKLGGLSIFPAKEPDSQRGGPEYDVLKIDVSSKDLESINRHLGILPNTTTHPDYHPHLTIAYLKPGTGHKYVGASGLEGAGLEFKSMVYSDDDRKKTELLFNQTQPIANAGIWEFVTDDQKVNEFIKWIRSQMSIAVLGTMTTLGTTDPDHWLMKHIQDTYTKGMGKVFEFIRKPIFAEKMPHYEGTKAEFLKSAFTRPVSPNRVKLLAGRAYSELSGMTDKMATQMQRSLTDGFIRGESPRDIARQLVKDVDGLGRKQANMIASTEITRAYNEGQLDSMEELGVEDVGVSVEWRVSKQGVTVLGNPSPCPVCAPLNGIVLKISEARGLLPRHPHCRCAWVASGVGESTKGQKRSQQRIVQAVKSSLLAERPKRKKTAAKPSRWAGSKAKIGKNRPKSILD